MSDKILDQREASQFRSSVAEFYDAVAGPFSDTRQFWWKDLEFIQEYYQPGSKVLDYGCGNGRLLELIKVPFDDYLGVDISAKLLEHARSKYPGYKYLHIPNESKLPIEDGAIDCIYSIAVFHHLNPKMAIAALEEIRRVLKPDGTVIITAWHLWQWDRFKYLLGNWAKFKFSGSAKLPFHYGDSTYYRLCYWWTLKRISRIAKQVGFTIGEAGFTYGKKNNKRNIYIILKKGT